MELVVGYLYNMDYSDEDAVVAIEDGAQNLLREMALGSKSTTPSEGNIAEIMASRVGTDEQILERTRAVKEADDKAVSSPLLLLFPFPMHSLVRLVSASVETVMSMCHCVAGVSIIADVYYRLCQALRAGLLIRHHGRITRVSYSTFMSTQWPTSSISQI